MAFVVVLPQNDGNFFVVECRVAFCNKISSMMYVIGAKIVKVLEKKDPLMGQLGPVLRAMKHRMRECA